MAKYLTDKKETNSRTVENLVKRIWYLEQADTIASIKTTALYTF